MTLIPPLWPKPPPFKWTELHDAALVILEKETTLDEEEFEAWLRQRPGATAIYLFLADEDAIRAELLNQVLSHPVPAFKMPETLAELIDDKGRMPSSSPQFPRVVGTRLGYDFVQYGPEGHSL